MNYLLHIETAVQAASVALSADGSMTGFRINPSQKDSAAWLHVAIRDLLQEGNLHAKDLRAVAVSAGPGSYTGLRVGMAAAKGLCYALNIPLITVSTLKMMAAAALPPATHLLCPMIDARRMEVFTAVYNPSLAEILMPHNLILGPESFAPLLREDSSLFFGNGSTKFQNLVQYQNAVFKELTATAEHMVPLACEQFLKGSFADLAYCEPAYGKDFYSPGVS